MARPIDPNRRSEILRAARAEFREHGYSGARMAAIADRTGIAAGTVYRYFPAKDALVVALGEHFFDRVWTVLVEVLDDPDGPASITSLVRRLFALAIEEQDILRLRQMAVGLRSRSDEVLAPYRRFLGQFAGLLSVRIADGRLRRYDALVLAELLTGIFEWVSTATLLRGEADLAHYETTLIAFLAHALLPEHGPA